MKQTLPLNISVNKNLVSREHFSTLLESESYKPSGAFELVDIEVANQLEKFESNFVKIDRNDVPFFE